MLLDASAHAEIDGCRRTVPHALHLQTQVETVVHASLDTADIRTAAASARSTKTAATTRRASLDWKGIACAHATSNMSATAQFALNNTTAPTHAAPAATRMKTSLTAGEPVRSGPTATHMRQTFQEMKTRRVPAIALTTGKEVTAVTVQQILINPTASIVHLGTTHHHSAACRAVFQQTAAAMRSTYPEILN